jgi:hypothetical protein
MTHAEEYRREYYLKNKERIKQQVQEYRSKNPELVADRRKAYREKNKEILAKKQLERSATRKIEFAKWKYDRIKSNGGRCSKCGYELNEKNLAAFVFHHRDRSLKKFVISKDSAFGRADFEEEVEKCDILCSNCHNILHYGEDLS